MDVSPGFAEAPTTGDERTHDYEIIIVTYFSRGTLPDVLAQLPVDVPLRVVDNARGADRVDELLSDRPAVTYTYGPGEGFAKAANIAARSSSYDIIVFLNPDCSPRIDQIDAVVRELSEDDALVTTGLTTALPDGRVDLGVGGWEPTLTRAAVHALALHKIFPRSGLWARPVVGVPLELDWLGSACMAMPRATFLELGGFDESYFIYSLDVEFGRTVREAGLRQQLLTDVVATHGSGESGGSRPIMMQLRGAMAMRYVGRHNPRRTAHLFRMVLTAGYLARYALCRSTGRDSTAADHAAFVRGMWAGAPTAV